MYVCKSAQLTLFYTVLYATYKYVFKTIYSVQYICQHFLSSMTKEIILEVGRWWLFLTLILCSVLLHAFCTAEECMYVGCVVLKLFLSYGHFQDTDNSSDRTARIREVPLYIYTEESHLTLRNHLLQPYTALDTLLYY